MLIDSTVVIDPVRGSEAARAWLRGQTWFTLDAEGPPSPASTAGVTAPATTFPTVTGLQAPYSQSAVGLRLVPS